MSATMIESAFNRPLNGQQTGVRPDALPGFFSESTLKLVFFGGKGGVGKTTTACAAAISAALARPGERFMLVSTDPAHSVRDCLSGGELPANLSVMELDASAEFDSFLKRDGDHLRHILEKGTFLDSGDVDGFLKLSLPGVDEMMAFLRIAQWVQQSAYATVFVDTAPTGHTLRLLSMPEFCRAWLDAMEALLAKNRYMASLFGGGGKAAANDPVERFVDEMSKMFAFAGELFKDKTRCRFVPVMIAEPMSVSETGDLLAQLDKAKIASGEIVVNRVIPSDAGAAFAPAAQAQARTLDAIAKGGPDTAAFASRTLWALPLSRNETTGIERLSSLFSGVIAPDALRAFVHEHTRANDRGTQPSVLGGVPAPQSAKLVFFAGKGGVGKTTMSCACAASLAEAVDDDDAPVLLVSVDPAHSISDCLGVPVGAEPVEITQNLFALEFDAERELEALRAEYLGELRRVFEKMMEGVEVSFEQEAMESLLSLTPPGLDEVMALIKLVEHIDSGRFSTIVLDTAPTGHLLRLLEMPALAEQWLQQIFRVLLKYEKLIRLPKVTAKLISLSRGVKKLRAMLTDNTRTALYPVTIATTMALEETRDLAEACGRAGVRVPGVIVNQACPADASGEFAAQLQHSESRVLTLYAAALPTLPRAIVNRGAAPRGLDDLLALGRCVFASSQAGKASRAA
jgi:arsenite/tail-anchored protein-transporting ATPase